MKIVVLGGYGNFGARISRALAGDGNIELVVAGRSAGPAQSLAREIGATHAVVDGHSPRLAQELRALGADLVIHTAGPFQQQDWGVALAAANAGCHYIDLADGRRFVCDFAAGTQQAFRDAGRCAVAGASTVPALSSAVIDALLPRFSQLEAIDICIAPAQRAPRGVATLAGVLSYCGAPVSVWQGGRWVERHGWSAPSRAHFARMRPRRGALCDIPDLELLPARYPGVRDVTFRAALEVGLTQQAFAALAWLRRRGVVREPARFARLLHAGATLLDPLGTPLGGMFVRLAGRGFDGTRLALAWHITAPDHSGPEIPCMPSVLLARRLARGEVWPAGAQPCLGLLALSEFEPLFARWGMATEVVEDSSEGALHGA
jgi:hypothetical protein